MKTKEEIFEKYLKKYGWDSMAKMCKADSISAMEEYAQQFQTLSTPDGWIDKDGHSFLNRKDTPYSAEAMKKGYTPFYFQQPSKTEVTDEKLKELFNSFSLDSDDNEKFEKTRLWLSSVPIQEKGEEIDTNELACKILHGVEFKDEKAIAKATIQLSNYLETLFKYSSAKESEQEKGEEIASIKIFEWLKNQGYQTDSVSYEGIRKYKVYFYLDMPEIINDAFKHFSSASEVTNPTVSDEKIKELFNSFSLDSDDIEKFEKTRIWMRSLFSQKGGK